MNGDFDQHLDEIHECPPRRPQSSMSTISQLNTFTDLSVIAVNNEQSITNQKSTISVLDDLLGDIDALLTLRQPNTSRRELYNEPAMLICQHKYASKLAAGGFFDQPKFCDKLKTEMKEIFSVETTITKIEDQSTLENMIIIEFKSKDQIANDTALEALKILLASVMTKLVDQNIGQWVKYKNCTRIIQAYADQNEYLQILCSHEEIGILISYFSKDKSTVLPTLCTTDAFLDKMLQKFLFTDISLPCISDLTTTNKSYLVQAILNLQNKIQTQNVFIMLELRCIHLFGLIDTARGIEKQIEEIKIKHASTTVELVLEQKQIKFLLDIHSDDLRALETNYNDTTIIKTLQKKKITAPNYAHDIIEKKIYVLASLCKPMDFEILEEDFGLIAHNECDNLKTIGRQYKCQIEIQSETKNKIYDIPTALVQDHISNKLTASAIEIHKNDLAEQEVDLVVICSTSMYLRDDILRRAGESAQQEYETISKRSSLEPFETNSGNLSCRRLLFLPWEINVTSQDAFYQSIRNFVSKAIQHAIKVHHTSIAFPSIGCGKLSVDKNIVANEMLVEAQTQLLSANVLLQINFVILPEQNDVFEAFQMKLENLQRGDLETKNFQIAYNFSTLKITIMSSSIEKQEECKKALNEYVKKSIFTCVPKHQQVLKRWTQPAINAFYKYCFDRNVVPDINIVVGSCKLFGLKAAVGDAENEYYREHIKQSEQARLIAIARDIIWAFQIDDNTWIKYKSELNALIEDAYSSKSLTVSINLIYVTDYIIPLSPVHNLSSKVLLRFYLTFYDIHAFKYLIHWNQFYFQFSYSDDDSVKYTIDFEQSIEICEKAQIQRKIIRNHGFDLPPYWAVQTENIAQFPVDENSTEYNEIRALFDTTMTNNYTVMHRIERIQNKQWYMQYNSYKSFSPKKNTEKKLFHGCPKESAQLIINSFFNRSFAGINGTAYGRGAYFSANAKYSNGYTKVTTSDAKKYMFVAYVLVGDCVRGNTNMKTPPAGFDSTTDGDHIFVTYRDDQAYAAYLIVYQ
ncbi:unnamed protein product [Rotaria socialis]|uniref:Poly [ADP-ribose] polymerase n=1 Tax=Rotaria socialis TaxID=392032 RepID=A0A820T2T9_9BILA|nr:unnamed protein product [Rotaria socialis]